MMTDEAEGVTEVVSYLADLHAATPTSSISHGDDHADALLEDSEALQDDNVSQVSLPVNLAAGAEFRLRTKEYTDTDCRRGFQDEFQFCDNTSDQLRQILGKSSYLDSTDEMDDSRTNEHKVREFAEAASSSIDLDIKKHPSSKKGNHRQRDQKQEASHLGMLDGKQPSSSSFVDGNEENEDENLTDMMPRSASTPSMPAEGLQPCETHYPIFRRRSAELRSSVSPTGKLSGGHYGMTGFCGKSSAVPLSRPVSVEAGLAAMGLREEMSPVQGYQSVPLYHRNGSESTLWDQEKEKLQSQLKLSRDAIASLQAENNIIKSKFSKMPGVVQQLKEQLNQSHAKLDYEKHQHLLEVSQMQRKLRFEQEKHEREAEQVFREVVRERDSLKAEVTALNKSVDALKKESNQLKLTAESSLKDHQKSTQATLFALKVA
ncbi:uncharacterized protein LOC134192569 isoform X2 [Corticium candelabrum]|uniref:uncharacterized protein LOC134192569 isoform X2 n=1 Tax=Corticium candelabrum TaxID=121492 RepID=UPI002E26C21D|nr:uncharacterized protein LOC134192569 isoform X2 [Corticium candelabrum]